MLENIMGMGKQLSVPTKRVCGSAITETNTFRLFSPATADNPRLGKRPKLTHCVLGAPV